MPDVDTDEIRATFISAMNDDLETNSAVKKLEELAGIIIHGAKNRKNIRGAQQLLKDLGSIFGLRLDAEVPEKRVLDRWDEHAAKFAEVASDKTA